MLANVVKLTDKTPGAKYASAQEFADTIMNKAPEIFADDRAEQAKLNGRAVSVSLLAPNVFQVVKLWPDEESFRAYESSRAFLLAMGFMATQGIERSSVIF
jgi:hypothetical protein